MSGAFRVRGGFCPGPLAKLRGSCSGSGNTSERTVPRTGKVQLVPSRRGSTGRRYCCSFGPGRACRRRGVGEVAGGSRCSVRACSSASRFRACLSACGCGGPGAETTQERTPEWDECPDVGCASPRRGRRKLVASSVYERAREAHTGSPFPGGPSPGSAGRATPFIKPCSWQALESGGHLRLLVPSPHHKRQVVFGAFSRLPSSTGCSRVFIRVV